MAESTNPNLSKQMIYSVFVRNHSREGTFAKVEEDLDRIRDLGTDILWLMPIHPTGKVERKGEDGSPYAIADYWKIDPKMGTEEDLKHLVQSAHEKGMKVILDIVFNHTSPDSKMVQEYPEWFYRDEDGKPYPMFREWSDIVDLDFSSKALQEELIRILKHYASIVDGFRCDVASRVPASFWKKPERPATQ
ncbi:alpha-amylase family glycosyl hydrolase [Allobaculum sp. Allo2]|uniref:alpha-amylase family glycosyl hydrolase n=1 Tax=Allobaculum sp. Allo2 TaxID=2853432 RepID=UPI001F61AC47|nr:alpha-amylase family glycosyl hydrolase [Allobaculum sp. Allo2]UNT93237.1 alpha-galactosidase [Allobaculum sp. Allo2]